MRILITGGLGFIGSHLAERAYDRGDEAVLFDNVSRPGATLNLAHLLRRFGSRVKVIRADVRCDREAIDRAVAGADAVYHLAGQVAVTTSIADPRADFEANALGTFNVLESIRRSATRPLLLFSSTNKVYGALEHLSVEAQATRYAFRDRPRGATESEPLDFHSPYGCSKGTADQYVRDYARIYGLKTVVFRQSCIYGERQYGFEDQGWVSHFVISALFGRKLTIYGDGKQVRDLLHVDDLASAFEAATRKIDALAGRVYNVGGGANNSLSLIELLAWIEKRTGRPIERSHAAWRQGDQPIFVCDTARAAADFGFEPKVPVAEGLDRLATWTERNLEALRELWTA
jgi:CDP-paratose 2-epimerase